MSIFKNQTAPADDAKITSEQNSGTLPFTHADKSSDPNSKIHTLLKRNPLSPTMTGVVVGAVAGSVLPIFGTFSGAILGGLAGKWYQRKSKPIAP